jgi:RimJ/RimL family protein N-acetyltransferase
MTPRLDPAGPGWAGPVTLQGSIVRLEPLALAHVDDLAQVAFDPAIWRWMPLVPTTVGDLRAMVEAALRGAATGAEVPFATVDVATGRAIGSTRYIAIVPEHRRLEIGWTWLGTAHQRTGANREAKRLMLAHAFEVLGANRVEFKTDSRNDKSRTALAGIGAQAEGIFRNHMLVQGGIRHSAYFSVAVEDWPQVRDRLDAGLAARR